MDSSTGNPCNAPSSSSTPNMQPEINVRWHIPPPLLPMLPERPIPQAQQGGGGGGIGRRTYGAARTQQLNHHLQTIWQNEMLEMNNNDRVFRQHQLPLARIKRVMKLDEEVKMISAEAPVVFAKACELFILELTIRTWLHTDESRRRVMQRSDVANAILHADVFEFLRDIIPWNEVMNDIHGVRGGADLLLNAQFPLNPELTLRQGSVAEQSIPAQPTFSIPNVNQQHSLRGVQLGEGSPSENSDVALDERQAGKRRREWE